MICPKCSDKMFKDNSGDFWCCDCGFEKEIIHRRRSRNDGILDHIFTIPRRRTDG